MEGREGRKGKRREGKEGKGGMFASPSVLERDRQENREEQRGRNRQGRRWREEREECLSFSPSMLREETGRGTGKKGGRERNRDGEKVYRSGIFVIDKREKKKEIDR